MKIKWSGCRSFRGISKSVKKCTPGPQPIKPPSLSEFALFVPYEVGRGCGVGWIDVWMRKPRCFFSQRHQLICQRAFENKIN